LRHDARVTSYKLALIRAINDVVLSFPDARLMVTATRRWLVTAERL
jgi:hypothetical protein